MLTFLKCLPEIISLILIIKKKIDEDKVDRKVSDDIKAIKQAFANRDASALNDVFNRVSDETAKPKP